MPRGARTIDPTTAVGRARLLVGDTAFVELVPPEADFVNFTYFGDDEIGVALLAGSGSITRAVGSLIQQLALNASLQGQSIEASDFSIDTKGRGSDLLEVAKSYFAQANEEDARYARDGDPFAGPDDPAASGGFMVVNTKIRRRQRLGVEGL